MGLTDTYITISNTFIKYTLQRAHALGYLYRDARGYFTPSGKRVTTLFVLVKAATGEVIESAQ